MGRPLYFVSTLHLSQHLRKEALNDTAVKASCKSCTRLVSTYKRVCLFTFFCTCHNLFVSKYCSVSDETTSCSVATVGTLSGTISFQENKLMHGENSPQWFILTALLLRLPVHHVHVSFFNCFEPGVDNQWCLSNLFSFLSLVFLF